nr:DNA-directed RNA polymerase subunit beta' [Sedimentibacter sp.]
KVEKVDTAVWDVLDEIIKDHTVLLNRAPTLHRLGIQSFEPVLVEGKAIKLHPLVCTAYNADFDGDQMAVHVPLSVEAQAESRFLMMSVNNILAPKDGRPITTPTQDMVLGSYYMTLEIEGSKGEGMIFKDYEELIMAYFNKYVDLHARVKVRKTVDGESRLVESTVGRFIFNEDIPQDLGFVDREKDKFSLEVDYTVKKKSLEEIIYRCFRKHGNEKTAEVLDGIKEKGFRYSTLGAITISVSDITVPEEKKTLIEQAEKKVLEYEKKYRRGLMTDEERYENVIKIWNQTTEDVTNALMNSLDPLNPIYIMSVSGARGGRNQIKQLAGMRGLMASAIGKTVEVPVKSNFREGLSVLEFFLSATGARKGLTDTALRTADSGYLTRRLVDVSQDIIVREEDCGTNDGIEVEEFADGKEVIEKLSERCADRFAAADVVHPETGEVFVKTGDFISEEMAMKIEKSGIKKVKVRSVLTCKTVHGVCAKCYGTNLATGKPVNVGAAVGIIAAQSIGEPGTQLTMRTFHMGGIAAATDITQGLPRIEELFEARKPKGQAIISEISGKVTLTEKAHKREITITNYDEKESKTYLIPYGSKILVSDGDYIEAGDKITDGSINPHDILNIKGMKALESYILMEVQRVYRMQGVDISDKHVEVIIRQMVNKVRVEESGDTSLLPGSLVSNHEFERQNEEAIREGKEPAKGEVALLGITKSSLATDSFLASASFQETTRVLTDAATKGKVDNLIGLKENVIIGKLIPAGTGMKRYRNIGVMINDADKPADNAV